MLTRAILPLTRPNVLASAARVSRVSALYTQRPRWYAKGSKNTPYELPESIKQKSEAAPQASQEQHAKEQPEFETKAKPEETDAAESNNVSDHPRI